MDGAEALNSVIIGEGDMRKVGVIIGPISNDLLWETLKNFLNKVSDIDLEYVENENELKDKLRSQTADVLILEISHDSDHASKYQPYYDINPELGIIVIDPIGTDLVIRLQNTGCQQLVRLIRSLSGDEGDYTGNTAPRILYLRPSGEPLITSSKEAGSLSNLSYLDSREHLRDLCKWIELWFHWYFAGEEKSENEAYIPGWAMSAGRARALLGGEYASATQVVLSEARHQLELRLESQDIERQKQGVSSRFAAVVKAFGLNDIEKKIFILCLSPELDDRYARVLGYFNDDLTRCRPTPSLLNSLLCRDSLLGWDICRVLRNEGQLSKYRIVLAETNDAMPQSRVGLRLAPEILAYLRDEPGQAPEYGPHLQLIEPKHTSGPATNPDSSQLRERLNQWRLLPSDHCGIPVIQLIGDDSVVRWFAGEAVNGGDTLVLLNPTADSTSPIQ